MPNTKTAVQKKKKAPTSERSKQMTQLELSFIIFILKKLSSKESPLSAAKIAHHMESLTDEEHSEKTILRKLKLLTSMQQSPDEEIISNTLWLTFGGNVVELSNEKKSNITKKQSQFYFEPLLTESDLSLVCGAITSNRYLTEAEKKYLLSREMTLTSMQLDESTLLNQIDTQAHVSGGLDKQSKQEQTNIYHNSTLLRHINQLYDAIDNGYQIEIVYGVYDLDPKGLKIQFHPRNAEKPYKLNPYAFVWNSGSFYLLATHSGHENPVHFRVDRIISIKPVVTEDDATIKQSRDKVPPMLMPFIKPLKNKKYEFLADKYTATYPLMGIYDDTDYKDCFIECTANTLSILIDAFGTDLRIYPSPIPHSEDELDFHGRPQDFLAIGIRQVQYDNILQFCLQQHTSVTALYPHELVTDVMKELANTVKTYEKVLQQPALTLNDFKSK